MTVALSRLNFRDLGGLCTEDGRVLRSGLLYRSEGPASFAAEHHDELEQIGFRLICDLRAEVERSIAPNDWNTSARLFHLALTDDLRTKTNAGWDAMRLDPTESGAVRAMTLNYQAIPSALYPHLRDFVDALLDDGVPALIHCTAGKDRTGVLVALLLSMLGVAPDDVRADYQRSDVFGKNLRLAGSIGDAFNKTFGFVPSEASIAAMIGVDDRFLESAFAAVQAEWGSVQAYFKSAGIDADRHDRLCALLLTES